MRLGLSLPNYRSIASPEAIVQVATTAEEAGFASVWATDHVVVPHPYAERFGEVFYEPLMTLAHVAALTRRVQLGTTILILAYRNPLVVAKSLATLDQLSGGRLIIGAGVGWARLEFQALGIPFAERGQRTDEALAVMNALWTQERPSFAGRYVSFQDVHALPRPVQQPRPPIWIGGRSRRAMTRAIDHGDAWHPFSTPHEDLARAWRQAGDLAARRGRTAPLQLTLRLTVRLQSETASGARQSGTGTVEQVTDDLLRYEEIGVSHAVVDLASTTTTDLLRGAEALARAALPRLAPRAGEHGSLGREAGTPSLPISRGAPSP